MWGIPAIQGNPPLQSSFLVPLRMPGACRVAKSSAASRQGADEAGETGVFSPASLLAAQRTSVEVSHFQDILNQGTLSPSLPQRSQLQ